MKEQSGENEESGKRVGGEKKEKEMNTKKYTGDSMMIKTKNMVRVLHPWDLASSFLRPFFSPPSSFTIIGMSLPAPSAR